MKEKITAIIIETLREIGEEVSLVELKTPTPETPLYGFQGGLDSMTLVSLIADLEVKLSETFGQDIVLADERAMSQTHSPFRRVSSLVDYIETMIES